MMREARRDSRVPSMLLFILLTLLTLGTGSANAALSCNSQSGITTIGLEWVAKQCIPEGVTDSTSIYYENNMLECSGSSVGLYAWYGDTQGTPTNIINYAKSQGYRVFRNKEGSHIVAVHRYYTGLIDGKSMGGYATGQVYTDVFKEALYPTNPVPDCKGFDFNRPPLELCAASTANLATGRLSHGQRLFWTQSSQPLSLAVSLFYVSQTPPPSAIGGGWSHSYETALVSGATSATVWVDGKRRVYTLTGTTYTAPKGDHASLVKNADNSFTLTEKDGLKRNFSPVGKATSLIDRNGNTTSFTYDANGRLTAVTDPNGRSATFGYDVSGRLASVTDPMGATYSLGYTTGGLLSAVTNPDAGQWRYGYNANGLLTTKTDPENNTATYTYDANKKLTGVTDPAGKTRGYGYPAQPGNTGKVPDPYPVNWIPAKQTTFTEKDGGTWSYTFETRTEAIKSITDPLGNITSFTYDADGNVLSKTEPGIGTTTYTYDSKGNILSVKDPLNQTTMYTYNGFGQALTITGAPGNTTNTYDAKGNLLTTTDPAGAVTTYGYDARGNLTTITDARSQVTTLAYDTANNLTSVTLPTGAVTHFTYDGNGNRLTITDPAGKITRFEYNGMNRQTMVTDPLNHVTSYAYDKNGNPVTATDASNNATTRSYNPLGQLTQVRDALNHVTTFAWGVAGCPSCTGVDQLTGVTDANGRSTAFTYDKLGRLTAETDPLNHVTGYSYGPTRNPAARTDANSATINYTYDPLQRLTTKTYPDATTESYTYDSRNNILTATNKDLSYAFVYDAANRVTSVTDSRGYAITYQYDANGNRTQMKLQPGTPDEKTVTYTHDAANRPASITTPAGLFTFGHDASGRRTSLSYPHGVTASYGYDDAGRLTNLAHTAGATPIATFAYSHDNVGNRTAKNSENYLYDLIYRLLQTASPTQTETFAFDPVGNRTSGPGVVDTRYQFDAANRMTRGRTLDYGYDNNGNQIARTVPGAADKSWTQSWDYENRLTKVEKIKGAERKTVTFRYDPFGRRIEKKVETVIDGVMKAVTHAYVYDQEDIAIEITTDGTTTTTTRYYHGPGIDEPLAMERGGSYYYYHADGLGSVTAITDQNRNVVQSYEYDSFGRPTPSTNFRNSLAYTGKEWDWETGLHKVGVRYYDYMEGRFISRDPIGIAGGINLYAYTYNNPINFRDPTGMLVYADYARDTGVLTVTDYDTGERASMLAESGGKPWGDPIPKGAYEILNHPNADFLRLDPALRRFKWVEGIAT